MGKKERNTYLVFIPGYTRNGTPNVPDSLAQAYSRMPLSGPRSMAHKGVAARCWRRCASVMVGRKFSMRCGSIY
jgi:hypothetical protein